MLLRVSMRLYFRRSQNVTVENSCTYLHNINSFLNSPYTVIQTYRTLIRSPYGRAISLDHYSHLIYSPYVSQKRRRDEKGGEKMTRRKNIAMLICTDLSHFFHLFFKVFFFSFRSKVFTRTDAFLIGPQPV